MTYLKWLLAWLSLVQHGLGTSSSRATENNHRGEGHLQQKPIEAKWKIEEVELPETISTTRG